MSTTEIYALDIDDEFICHLADPESVNVIRAERLSAEVLEDELAAKVYDWQIKHLREHGVPATASVLEDEFDDITIDKPQTAIGDLITRLRGRYARNEGREALRNLAKLAGENPVAVGAEMLRQGKKLTEVSSQRGDQFGTGEITRALDIYDAKVKRGPGPSLGFEEIDAHFHGIQGITSLLAPPKTYKSWFGVNGTIEQVIKGGRPKLYSLELPAEDTHWRILCMAANIPFWKYERGALTNDEQSRITQASSMLDECGTYSVDKPPPGERSAQMLIERALAEDATCVFVDQLQYVENEKGTNLGTLNDTGYYWEVMSLFRDYSDDIPIFVVHQFNRSTMGAKEMPEMQQAKGSSAIEETSHLVLGLWANKEMRKNNVIEVGTLASRSYSHKNWHVEVGLTNDCRIDMMGEVTDDDEE